MRAAHIKSSPQFRRIRGIAPHGTVSYDFYSFRDFFIHALLQASSWDGM